MERRNRCVRNRSGNIQNMKKSSILLKHKSSSLKSKTWKLNGRILNSLKKTNHWRRNLTPRGPSFPLSSAKRKGWSSTPLTKWKTLRSKWKTKYKLMTRTRTFSPTKVRMKIHTIRNGARDRHKEGRNGDRGIRIIGKLHQGIGWEDGFLPYLWEYLDDCYQIN